MMRRDWLIAMKQEMMEKIILAPLTAMIRALPGYMDIAAAAVWWR